MKNLISGEIADDCLAKTLKALNRYGGASAAGLEGVHCFPHPVSIRLENPLARFSFCPAIDPREGIILGICALAGVNIDDLLAGFDILSRPLLPGPYIRGFDSESAPYQVDFKNAGARKGRVDQFAEAVGFLQKNPEGSFMISLRDPKKKRDQGNSVAASLHLYSEDGGRLGASVYVPEMEVALHLVHYIFPVYTFIQQMAATLTGKESGAFYVLSDRVFFAEGNARRAVLTKPWSRTKNLKDFKYTETKQFDLRYIDMAIQHWVDFVRRIRGGDLLVENPFKGSGHLEVFHDYAEVFRYGEAADRRVSRDAVETEIRHPQLACYYDF